MLRQSAPQRAAQHQAGVAVSPPDSMCPVCLGACALSLRGGRESGPAQPAVPPCTYPHPLKGQKHEFCDRARSHTTAIPVPDYNTSSRSFVSVDPSSGPCLQQQTLCLQAAGRISLQLTNNSSGSSSTAEIIPPCPGKYETFYTHSNAQTGLTER